MRLLFKAIVALSLLLSIYWPALADEIAVVKTRSIPIVENILDGFQAVCAGKHTLTIYDMQGKQYEGRNIIAQIEKKIDRKNIKAIFTIGLPATMLVKQSITSVPIVYAMISDPEHKGISGDNICGISQNLSADMQLQTIAKTLPEVKQLAIMYNHELSGHKMDIFAKAAKQYGLELNRYQVATVKDVPKTLRQVITENDALLLLPDKVVINQASLEYFVTTVIENGFPTISYNKYLVKAGFLMGLAPDYWAIGQQAGDLLCNDIQHLPTILEPKRFEFAVNATTAKTIRTKLVSDLMKLADHVY